MASRRQEAPTVPLPDPTSPGRDDAHIYLLPDSGVFRGDDDAEIAFDGFEPFFDADCTVPVPRHDDCVIGDRLVHCRVAGTTHHAVDVQLPQFDVGSQVYIVPEPDNPYDPFALKVVGPAGTQLAHAGYIPAELARGLAPVHKGKGGSAIVIKTFSRPEGRIGLRLVGSVGGLVLAVQSIER